MSVVSLGSTRFCVVLCVGVCRDHFVMVLLNLNSYLHCLQQSFFEHLFNLYHKRINKRLVEL